MKKIEAILLELANGNYDIASITEKTEIKKYRVRSIIETLILRKKIEGELDEEEKEFVPGTTTKRYKLEIVNERIAIGMALFSILISQWVILLVFPLTFLEYYDETAYVFVYVAAEQIIVGLLIGLFTRKRRTGKMAFTISVSITLFVIAALIFYVLLYYYFEWMGPLSFTIKPIALMANKY